MHVQPDMDTAYTRWGLTVLLLLLLLLVLLLLYCNVDIWSCRMHSLVRRVTPCSLLQLHIDILLHLETRRLWVHESHIAYAGPAWVALSWHSSLSLPRKLPGHRTDVLHQLVGSCSHEVVLPSLPRSRVSKLPSHQCRGKTSRDVRCCLQLARTSPKSWAQAHSFLACGLPILHVEPSLGRCLFRPLPAEGKQLLRCSLLLLLGMLRLLSALHLLSLLGLMSRRRSQYCGRNRNGMSCLYSWCLIDRVAHALRLLSIARLLCRLDPARWQTCITPSVRMHLQIHYPYQKASTQPAIYHIPGG